MIIETKAFGQVEITDDKIITFPGGIIGFPDMKRFTLLHDEEKGVSAGIRWRQSLEEPGFAMTVIDPLMVKEDYNPEIDDELLTGIGEVTSDNLLVLVTVRVPSDLKQMSVNLQGPIIINVDERKACQIIVDTDSYPVRFPIYEILQSRKAGD